MKNVKIATLILFGLLVVNNAYSQGILEKLKQQVQTVSKAQTARGIETIKKEKIGFIPYMEINHVFFIQSAINYKRNDEGYFDASGGGNARENLQLNKISRNEWGLKDKLYTFENTNDAYYFFIHPKHDKYVSLDIDGGVIENGRNVQLWESNGSVAQKFSLYHIGGGKFRITAANEKYVITAQSRHTGNGNNLVIFENENGIYQEWYLLRPNMQPFIPYE